MAGIVRRCEIVDVGVEAETVVSSQCAANLTSERFLVDCVIAVQFPLGKDCRGVIWIAMLMARLAGIASIALLRD